LLKNHQKKLKGPFVHVLNIYIDIHVYTLVVLNLASYFGRKVEGFLQSKTRKVEENLRKVEGFLQVFWVLCLKGGGKSTRKVEGFLQFFSVDFLRVLEIKNV